ncbi:MAG: protein translocase subunit SecD, partial [Deltaproteobacteria bacterium]
MAFLFLIPTFWRLPPWWPGFLPKEEIRLGLDLQGGMHLVLGVQAQKAVESELEKIRKDLKQELKKEKIFFTSLEREGSRIEVV